MESKIVIAKPCHENWNKMTPEEKGRHCAVCSKVVKDFTGMKTNEIVKELQTLSGEVCGRVEAKNLTPANKKQQLDFWIRSFVFRKAIYPLMAFLGVSLLTKKSNAQNHTDYPVKGKIATNDYHVQKKIINLVVKTPMNTPVSDGSFRIISGVRGKQGVRNLDKLGRAALIIDPDELTGDEITLEVFASGYEYHTVNVKLVKNIQTVEIKMEHEFMIMGDIAYIPEKNDPIEESPIIDTVLPVDSTKLLKVEPLEIKTIETLPFLNQDTTPIEISIPVNETIENRTEHYFEDIVIENVQSVFNVYPVPSNTQVNIVTRNEQAFQVNVFDGEGKTRQTVINCMGTYVLDVTSYIPGVYYLQLIVDGKAIETKKVIVTK